jgi:microcystin-dependent protein
MNKKEAKNMMNKKIIAGLSLLISASAMATTGNTPQTFTYQGKILNSSGTAPLTTVISLTLDVYDPFATCLLYEEQQANIDLSQTNGLFAVQVGSAVGDAKRTANDQALAMSTIFANSGSAILAASTTNCSGGYTPGANDGRLLRVKVTNGGSTVTISPDLQINAVPNAMVADTLQGSPLNQVVVPAGIVSAYLGTVGACPTGYVLASGQTLNKSAYPALFTALGNTAGTTFIVPDLRGLFLRGLDTTGNVDPAGVGRTLGNVQQDQLQGHFHGSGVPANVAYYTGGGGTIGFYHGSSDEGFWGGQVVTSPTTDGSNGTPRTGPETRVKNAAVNYCVKY